MKRKPTLVGSHTENSIGKYFKTLDDLDKEYRNYRNVTFHQTSSSRLIENGDLDENAHLPLLDNPQANNLKKDKVLDWWSKYEASKAKKQQEEMQKYLGSDEKKIVTDKVAKNLKKKNVNESMKIKPDMKKIKNLKIVKNKVSTN